MHLNRYLMRVGFAGLGLLLAGTSDAAVIVSSGTVDVSGSAVSGKQGSVDSDNDPVVTPDASGTAGLVAATRIATAGPVPPGQIVTLPGTNGISTSTSMGSLDIQNNGQTIEANVSVINAFENLDGGLYTANGRASTRVAFTVTEDSPYTIAGSFNVDDEDVLWQVQLQGPDGFLINNATTSDNIGSFNESGTLRANTEYIFTARVNISSNGSDAPGESSSMETTLNIVPEPGTAILLALPALALIRRRR